MGEVEFVIVVGEFTTIWNHGDDGGNGTGKVTFIWMLAGRLQLDEAEVPVLNVTCKLHKIIPKSTASVHW